MSSLHFQSLLALHDLSGNPEETLEEELQPKQHREMFEEAKEKQLGSENVGVPMLEAPTDELPAREPEFPTEDVEEVVHEHFITKDKDIFLSDDSPNLQAVTSFSERKPSPTLEEGVSLETNSIVEMESQGMLCSGYTKESCNISEHQEPKLDVSSSALQSKEEADKETSTRSQSAAAGKKKKKKKRAKKKGGVHEDEKRHANKETCSEEKATESTGAGDVTELAIDGSITKAEDRQDRLETGGGGLTKPTETFIPNEAIGESVVNDDEKQSSEIDNIVVEASTAPESVAHAPAHALDKEKDELNLESETVEAAEAVEIFEPPRESRSDAKNDEQDDEQGLETETVETVEAVKPDEPSSDIKPSTESTTDGREDRREDEETPKTEERSERCCVPEEHFSSSEHVHDSKSGLNADGVDQVCRTAVAESLREHDMSAGSIQTESGSVGGAGEDGHLDENKPDSMNRGPEKSEPSVLRDDHISTNRSDSEDTSACQPPGDGSESLSGSGPASRPSAGADGPDKVSDEVSEEEDERKNDGEDGGENSNLIIEPELKPEEELKVDLREAGVPSESNCSSCEEKNDGLAADVAAVLESEKSLEAPEPAEGLGDAEDQGFQGKDQTPELNNPEPPQAEALHQCPVDDHVHSTESAIPEDSEHKMIPNNQLHETPLNSERETLEPIKDDWDDESAQPNLHESEEDEEEGQSFDFDDIDVETAVTADLQSPKMEAIGEGVEVLSYECDPGRSSAGQSNTDSNKNPSSDPAGEEKCTVDAGQRSDTQETVASENMHEEQKNPAEEEACVEEGTCSVVGQAVSLPVEEGLGALQQLHGGDLLLEKSPELVAGNPEAPQAAKEAKKSSKKGKAKGKEDCKMS